MSALGSQAIKDSYEQLLHVDRDGGGNSTTFVDVKDGDNGTTFLLKLATNKVGFGSTFYAAVSSGGTSYLKMVSDNGSDVYVYVHWNGTANVLRIASSAPA